MMPRRLLDATTAADMLARENSGFSVDASVRITLIDRDVPSYFQSLEHLLRYCARPPFALERLSVRRGEDGRISRVCYVLPRHKAADIRLIPFITDPSPIRKILTHLGEPLEPPPVSPARGPPTDWGELVQVHDDRAIFQATDRRTARDRHPQPLTAFHATVRTAREKSGFKAGLRPREKSGLERG
jgi:hypothetical protein